MDEVQVFLHGQIILPDYQQEISVFYTEIQFVKERGAMKITGGFS